MIDQDVKSEVRAFILSEFLPGEKDENLTNDLGLISEGIIDSIGTLRLVSFLEEKFGVSIAAHEVDEQHLDTIDLIAATVSRNNASS